MIQIPYSVRPSRIPRAGQGLFLERAVPRGTVIVAPADVRQTVSIERLLREPDLPGADTSIRWFEDIATLSPEEHDERFINHSFTPTGLWHLGFIFALQDLAPGTELTIDYRHILASGHSAGFQDAATGREITGIPWPESLRETAAALHQLALANIR
jgi:SET domain